MATYILPPNSDNGPNLANAVPGPGHFSMVSQDPNDGDTSYLTSGAVSAAYDTLLRIGGQTYLSAAIVEGASYVITDDPAFLLDPSDGHAWTKAKLATTEIGYSVDSIITEVFGINASSLPDGLTIQSVAIRSVGKNVPSHGLPTVIVTELVLLVAAIPARPTATEGAIVGGSALATGGSPVASDVAVTASAAEQAIAASSTAAAIGASASISAPPTSSGTHTLLNPDSSLAAGSKPSGVPSSQDPTATPSVIAPSAAASAPPVSTGSES